MSDNRDLPDSRWWRVAEMAAWHGSPRLGRLSASRPAGVGAAFGIFAGALLFLGGAGFVGAVIAFAVMFGLIYGNGMFLRAYLRRGGTFSDGRGGDV